MREIAYVNLSAQWNDEKQALLPIIEEVLRSGNYVGSEEINRFEDSISRFNETRYAIALNSGTDALICGMAALGIGPGDEVITPPNSFVASTSAVIHVGAKPVFVDVLDDQTIDPDQIESAITKKTQAIMPVHLTGRMARMKDICEIANKHNLSVVEDAAQAIGSMQDNRPSGSIGTLGCFSTHPLKNLNACGDGGFVTTDDENLDREIRLLRNHGLLDRNRVEKFGSVSRMDVLQAAILNYRLTRLPEVNLKRRNNASLYKAQLNSDNVYIPKEISNQVDTYHTFVIQSNQRDQLREFLLSKGIQTAIHYPIPIHLQPAAKALGYKKGDFPVCEQQAKRILTLPINQYMTAEDISYVASNVNKFFEGR
jgi:dTDP-4-amino-4,6-dideoxygalactose transaminase